VSDVLLGYCGLYCGGCGFYQGTVSGRPLKDNSGNPMICDGCNSGRTTPHCTDCEIKKCSRRKGIRYCLDCADNPCGIMKNFMNDPKYPYHLKVQDDMKRLKLLGLDKWSEEIKKRYVCSGCSVVINWFETECHNCGMKLKL
jgi:hypothetical protein